MALIMTANGIVGITGGFGGTYFARDNSGLHQTAKPRRVHKGTQAQVRQRNAFIKARGFCKDDRCVSYNIYRALNGLPMQQPPLDYQIPGL